jgi:hypothetical protein
MDTTIKAIAITNDHGFSLGRDMLDNFYSTGRVPSENLQNMLGTAQPKVFKNFILICCAAGT